MLDQEARSLIRLMITPGLGHGLIARCVERFGSATQTAELGVAGFRQIQGIGQSKALKIVDDLNSQEHQRKLDDELRAMDQRGTRLMHRDDADYPRALKLIPDAPLVLWVVGQIEANDALALGMVGSRKCSHYGREQSGRFASQAVQAGLTVVSGGAYGVDTEAHRAAVQSNGRTLAVIGSGLANPYPRDNAALFDRIVSSGQGALISELPMHTAPNPENFPRRNSIISGLSLGVLVIEAALRSGALITARQCVEEHGRELMAVPGRVDSPTSAGCHKMIQEGWARLVMNIADVLDSLGDAGASLKQHITINEHAPNPNAKQPSSAADDASLFDAAMNQAQKQIVQALDEPLSLDALCHRTNLPAATLSAELTMLEIRGAVQRQGNVFKRKR